MGVQLQCRGCSDGQALVLPLSLSTRLIVCPTETVVNGQGMVQCLEQKNPPHQQHVVWYTIMKLLYMYSSSMSEQSD